MSSDPLFDDLAEGDEGLGTPSLSVPTLAAGVALLGG